MKLYKLIEVRGAQSASIFPPKISVVHGDPELVLAHFDILYRSTFEESVRILKSIGFTEAQAYALIAFWFNYAYNSLKLTGFGCRQYVRTQVWGLTQQWIAAAAVGSTVTIWPFVILAIAVAFVAGGLYVWVQCDVVDNYRASVPNEAYVLRLGEEMRECELAYVGPDNRGIYEEGGNFGPVITSLQPNVPILGGVYDLFHLYGGMRLRRKWMVLTYVWRWYVWVVKYIGDVYRVEHKRYRLKKPTLDPFTPPGVWVRPGTSYGETGYKGPWNYYWLKPG